MAYRLLDIVLDITEFSINHFIFGYFEEQTFSEYQLSNLLMQITSVIMSNISISSAEIAYPTDSENGNRFDTSIDKGEDALLSNVDFDRSTITSTSNPERFSEITFSSNCIQELVPGMCFEIKGIVPKTCERFSINLVKNNTNRDIALHLNPRMPQNCVVRNSKHKKRWGKEEVASPVPFDLSRGNDFIIHILVTEECYMVAINGRHFASFAHRFPYNKVKGVEIRDVADVEVEQIRVSDYPVPTKMFKPNNLAFDYLKDEEIEHLICFKSYTECSEDTQIEFLPMPYYGRFEERFTSGKEIHVIGRVKVLPHSFFINLQDSSRVWPHPNIPLHLNPRFGHVGKKNVIIRNSWLNGKWDEEERCITQDPNSFVPGCWFHLCIACHDEDYQICLNKILIAEFPFRINPNIVNTLVIQGDVKLFRVFCRSLR